MNSIIRNKDIRHGKFIFSGTRITVEDIIEFLLAGLTFEEIRREYPTITDKHLKDFVQFLNKILKEKVDYFKIDANSPKDIEKLYNYEGCLNFFKNIKAQDFQKKEIIQKPEMVLCLKIALSTLRKYQSKKGKNEIFA